MTIVSDQPSSVITPRRDSILCEFYENVDLTGRCTRNAAYRVHFIGCTDHPGPLASCEQHAALARIANHPDNVCPCGKQLTCTRLTAVNCG